MGKYSNFLGTTLFRKCSVAPLPHFECGLQLVIHFQRLQNGKGEKESNFAVEKAGKPALSRRSRSASSGMSCGDPPPHVTWQKSCSPLWWSDYPGPSMGRTSDHPHWGTVYKTPDQDSSKLPQSSKQGWEAIMALGSLRRHDDWL